MKNRIKLLSVKKKMNLSPKILKNMEENGKKVNLSVIRSMEKCTSRTIKCKNQE